MSSLLDGISNQFSDDAVAEISQHLGAEPSSTAKAIQLALPLLLGGLANNASDPAGAESLDSALARDHDGSLLDDLSTAVLAGLGASGSSRAVDGAGILGHIFGDRQGTVQNGIERSTGLDGRQVMQLLMMLAPIVMSYLGRQKRERDLDAGGVSDVLQNERQRMETHESGIGGLLGQLFDRNHDGSVADDIARMAPQVLGGLFGRRG